MANKVEVRITGKNDSADAFKDVERSLDRLKQGLEAIGFGLSVREIAEQVRGVAETFDRLSRSAEKTGIGVEKLQELQYAAKMVDVPAERLDGALAKLSRTVLHAAEGNGQAVAAFRLLGVSVTDSSGKIRPLDDIISQLAAAFPKLKDGTEKTGVAMEIFGRGGSELVPFLNHLQEFSGEARRLNLVIGADLVEAGAALDDNLKTLDASFAALKNRIIAEVLPSFVSYSQQLIQLAQQSNPENFSGIGRFLISVVATADAAVVGVEMLWTRLKDTAQLASTLAAMAQNPSSAHLFWQNYRDANKGNTAEYQRLKDEFWQRMEALYRPEPLPTPKPSGGGGEGDLGGLGKAGKDTSDAMASATAKIKSILAEIAGANGDAAEKIRQQWNNKADDIRKIFEKFPDLAKQFGDVDKIAELTGRVAALKEQTKEAADEFAAANKAYHELVSQKQLPGFVATPAVAPTLKTDMAGAELDRFFADRQAQADLAEKLMKDSLSPAQQYEIELAKLNELYAQGSIDQQAYDVALVDLKLRFSESAQVVQQLSYGMGYAFGSFLQTLRQSGSAAQAFTSFADSLISDMERVITQMIAMQLMQRAIGFLVPAFGGGAINLGSPAVDPSGGTGILPGMSPAAMPHFASGGFLPAGRMAMVGEHGPEPVLFGANATILPNSVLGGGGKPDVHVQVVNQGMPKNATASDPTWNDKMKQWHIQLHLDDAVNNGPLSRGQSGF